jgi:predicted nuclease of restriction endonuclease-like (RecB) superfamily
LSEISQNIPVSNLNKNNGYYISVGRLTWSRMSLEKVILAQIIKKLAA